MTNKKDKYFELCPFDAMKAVDETITWIQNEVNKTPFKRVVVGVSGGIDSAVVLALCVQALRPENVFGVNLPYESISSHATKLDAMNLCKNLGVKLFVQPINGVVDNYFQTFLRANSTRENIHLRRGNVSARVRMLALFDYAMCLNAVVVGTENKTEKELGYFTIGGDSVSIFEPILKFSKMQIFEMAKALNISSNIIQKVPTAELWSGQTDEDEMGFTYLEADLVLLNDDWSDQGINKHKELNLIDPIQFEKVIAWINKMKFKQKLPISNVV